MVEDVRATARAGRADAVLELLDRAATELTKGRAAAAERAAEEAKALAPRSAAVREALGLALYQAERFREALRELQAYRRLSGRPDQNHLIGDCHRALGAPERAIPVAREALVASPKAITDEARAEAAVVGGAALADLGRFDEALTLLRRFKASGTAVNPHDLRVWYVTADVLERAGRRAEAAREFEKIMRHDSAAFDAAERLGRLR